MLCWRQIVKEPFNKTLNEQGKELVSFLFFLQVYEPCRNLPKKHSTNTMYLPNTDLTYTCMSVVIKMIPLLFI